MIEFIKRTGNGIHKIEQNGLVVNTILAKTTTFKKI